MRPSATCAGGVTAGQVPTVDRVPTPVAMTDAEPLTDSEREQLVEQYVNVYAESQQAYDAAIRPFAAGGIAATVSLATALDTMSGFGLAAIGLFLAALALNLASYWPVQFDMRKRIEHAWANDRRAASWNGWTHVTTGLNVGAGLSLVAGAILLALFVSSTV